MALRAFKATFLVAIDEEEARDDERRETDAPVTRDEVKAYLDNALIVGFNNEDHCDVVGIQSVEVVLDDLQELTPSELKRRYKK